MAFQKINGKDSKDFSDSPILKWQNIGQEAEGRFGGFKGNKYGPKSLVLIGDKTYASHTVIGSALADTPIGSIIKLVYLGKARGASGSEYKDFDVFVDTPDSAGTEPVRSNDVVTGLSDQQKFDLLLIKIQAEKGPVIATALKNATIMSNDKLGTLREAAAQVGVDTTPEDDSVPF
jgi:hypothetical protein